jgi:Rv0078B-related antitoxin
VEPREDTAAERLAQTFELFELGVAMMEARLRRQHPNASADKLEHLLDAWLTERPGAEDGDGPGVPVPLDRFR